jgi:hypothetical protein
MMSMKRTQPPVTSEDRRWTITSSKSLPKLWSARESDYEKGGSLKFAFGLRSEDIN